MKKVIKFAALALTVGFFAVSCSQAPEGEKVETEDKKEVNNEAQDEAKSMMVDVENSSIEWEGTKTGGAHMGTLAIKSGELKVNGNEIVGGSFVIDMNSLLVTDLEGKSKNDLEGHLKNQDFFEVEKFPEASFQIASVSAAEGDGVTHKVEGNLKMKGVEHGVTIPVSVAFEDGAVKASAPAFTINRQDWGINYKSSMKDVIINNEMGIKINLVAK